MTWAIEIAAPPLESASAFVRIAPSISAASSNAPAFVHDEVENDEDLIVEKSGLEPDRVAQFIDLLFQYIAVVPASDFYPAIETAEAAIGDTDPDDVLYLACAIATDGAIWSDDSDFTKQDQVDTYSTSDVITSFDTL